MRESKSPFFIMENAVNKRTRTDMFEYILAHNTTRPDITVAIDQNA